MRLTEGLTYADGLRRAATYCCDYIRDEEDRARMQRVLLRFAAVADCDRCDDAGFLRDDAHHPRADHHPMKGICRVLDVPNTIDCSPMIDFPEPEVEVEVGDYDGDLFSDGGGSDAA